MSEYKLPYKDERGFCNVLLSAIGGDGANMAAKLFFKIGVVELGLDGAYDAKYGSEKTGTPTDVSVRLCETGTVIRESGPANKPHVLCAFHDDLIEVLELYRGIHRNPTVIVNTRKSPSEIRDILRLPGGTIYTLDASEIAKETKSRINIPMLAMLCKIMNFPDEVAKNSIAKQWPRARESNVAAYESSVSASVSAKVENDGKYEYMPPKPPGGQVGYMNILNGGAIDALTHSTYGRRNQVAGRGFVPEFESDLCNGCAICMTACSDPGALIWVDGKVTGIDIAFCKGCMRCVEVCPDTKKGRALMRPKAMTP
ncbi:MAG: 2-oxoacid:acceptor oxidoreductase family protein [Deltaproteobacteria bacterium]|nr:2-oxoacid:acceptor oxidoreductase family protein [Deltaproteobacteria bacterium]